MEALLRVKKKLLTLEEHRLQSFVTQKEYLKQEQHNIRKEALHQADLLLHLKAIKGASIACYANYQASARGKIEHLIERIKQAEREIKEQRSKVHKLDVEVQLLDRFRERAYKQWLADADKEIEQLGAESYLSRFVREQNKVKPDLG